MRIYLLAVVLLVSCSKDRLVGIRTEPDASPALSSEPTAAPVPVTAACDLSCPAGPQGQAGAPGRDGRDGRDGLDGKSGADGKNGMDGQRGRDGVDGAPGKDGAPGLSGKNGLDGAAGAVGPAGERGVTGAAGPRGPGGEFYFVQTGGSNQAEQVALAKNGRFSPGYPWLVGVSPSNGYVFTLTPWETVIGASIEFDLASEAVTTLQFDTNLLMVPVGNCYVRFEIDGSFPGVLAQSGMLDIHGAALDLWGDFQFTSPVTGFRDPPVSRTKNVRLSPGHHVINLQLRTDKPLCSPTVNRACVPNTTYGAVNGNEGVVCDFFGITNFSVQVH